MGSVHAETLSNGGKNLTSWDLKDLKKAIQLNGTINNPTDTDKSWSIELAIPFKSVSMSGDAHPTNWNNLAHEFFPCSMGP